MIGPAHELDRDGTRNDYHQSGGGSTCRPALSVFELEWIGACGRLRSHAGTVSKSRPRGTLWARRRSVKAAQIALERETVGARRFHGFFASVRYESESVRTMSIHHLVVTKEKNRRT